MASLQGFVNFCRGASLAGHQFGAFRAVLAIGSDTSCHAFQLAGAPSHSGPVPKDAVRPLKSRLAESDSPDGFHAPSLAVWNPALIREVGAALLVATIRALDSIAEATRLNRVSPFESEEPTTHAPVTTWYGVICLEAEQCQLNLTRRVYQFWKGAARWAATGPLKTRVTAR